MAKLSQEMLDAMRDAGNPLVDEFELENLLCSADRRKGHNIVASDSDASVSLYSSIDAEYRSYFRKG